MLPDRQFRVLERSHLPAVGRAIQFFILRWGVPGARTPSSVGSRGGDTDEGVRATTQIQQMNHLAAVGMVTQKKGESQQRIRVGGIGNFVAKGCAGVR